MRKLANITTNDPYDRFTLKQLTALLALERALARCRKLNIGFFVEENNMLALPDRKGLVINATDHNYIRYRFIHVDDSGTIIDSGAWD